VIDPAAVAENVARVRERIRAAGGEGVELVAVTKTFPVEAILAAQAAGCRAIGENYAQELVAKLARLPEGGPRPEVHFIGHLQTNKVRVLAGRVDVVETVDRPSLVAELARRLPGTRVLVEVNVTGEPQKAGCEPAEAAELVARARAAGLAVEGLMTVGRAGPPEEARGGFRLLRRLADDLGLSECSMGMSGDLEVAVEEGATEVRVGTALFGPRVRGGPDEAR
jgi:pyridoxal phosphate enzyme (YggS family)